MARADDLLLLLHAATDLYCVGRDRPIALERAVRFLRTVLAAGPANAAALRLLGLVEIERGHPTAAARAYRALRRVGGAEQRLEAQMGLARCQLARRRPGRALAELGRIGSRDLQARADVAEPLMRYYACKAEVLRRVRQRRRARAMLRQAIARLERARLDAESLRFELELCRDDGTLLAQLPAMTCHGTPAGPPPPFGYSLPGAVLRQIRAACRGHDQERCGLLFGRGRRFARLRLLANTDPLPELACTSPVEERRAVWRQERRRGLRLLAEFHSHTAGPAVPSRADCAARGRLLVIYADAFDELRAFRVGGSHEATLRSERSIKVVP